jgi:HAD superfamily hydrolase (TIGR01509 family)
MTKSPVGAALFDIDGTLVDSNYLHVEAWSHALSDLGIDADQWRIHRMIGMDSAKLLETILGPKLDELGEEAKRLNASYYEQLHPRLRVFAGAHDLLDALSERRVTTVLATSAPQNELDVLLRVLDAGDSIDYVTSSEDVETAKPEPDIVKVALSRAGTRASRAVMIGDSVWDATAASRAGVDCIGVRSGGFSAGELRDAGAMAVYDDMAQLLERLDTSPLARLWS